MELYFAATVGPESGFIAPFINELTAKLRSSSVNESSYAEWLEVIVVGWICVTEQSLSIHKVRKPKFYYKKRKDETGEEISVPTTFEYEFIIDYEKVKELREVDYREYLIKCFWDTLSVLETDVFKKKTPDFNTAKFTSDLSKFFEKIGFTIAQTTNN